MFASIILLLSLLLPSTFALKKCAFRPSSLTPAFCAFPPSAPVKIDSYLGTWYQTHFSNGISRLSDPDKCYTANYSLQADNSIRVFNCASTNGTASECSVAQGRRKQFGRSGELEVVFAPGTAPRPYVIAALVGHPNYNYAAAAVYNCEVIDGKLVDGFYIIMRSPFRINAVLRVLKKQLKCRGYDIRRQKFVETKQGKDCKYFFGPDGYTVSNPFLK